MNLKEFFRPTKFKVIFTIVMILVGSFILNILAEILGFSVLVMGDTGNVLLNFFRALRYSFFSHFLLIPMGTCLRMGGGGIDIACFLKFMFRALLVQIPSFYLIACLIKIKKAKQQ